MIKGTGTLDGRKVLMLGLSFGNLRKFLAEPGDTFIKIDGREMELPFDVLIFSGETEAHMADMIRIGIGPDTIVHVRPEIKVMSEQTGHRVLPMNVPKENLTRVQWENDGWYICRFTTIHDLMVDTPVEAVGPYATQAEAIRIVNETTDFDDYDEAEKKVRPYDPSRDRASKSKGVQLELQQAEELRDVPETLQGD